jgi:hypothetical protein
MLGIAGINTSGVINPKSISPGNMLYWYDASKLCITGTNEGAITAVNDLSGTALTAPTVASPNQPIWALGNPSASAGEPTFNYGLKNSIYFQTAGTDVITTNGTTTGGVVTYTNGLTIWCAFAFNSTASNVLTNGEASPQIALPLVYDTYSNWIQFGFNGGLATYAYYYPTAAGYEYSQSVTIALNDNHLHTACATHDTSGNTAIYIDGQANFTGGSVPWQTGSTGSGVIGSTTATGFATGQLAEIMSWSTPLNAQQILTLHNRAKSLWNV